MDRRHGKTLLLNRFRSFEGYVYKQEVDKDEEKNGYLTAQVMYVRMSAKKFFFYFQPLFSILELKVENPLRKKKKIVVFR